MDEESVNKAPARTRKGVGPSAAEESLTDALNGLEQILEQRRRTPHKPDTTPPNPASADAQYTIPLLHDVVVRGSDAAAGQIAPHGRKEPLASGAGDDEAYRMLAERLANEIEIIVQARVEEAVQEASRDIREQIRNHLEIMLPEIIEELKALGRR